MAHYTDANDIGNVLGTCNTRSNSVPGMRMSSCTATSPTLGPSSYIPLWSQRFVPMSPTANPQSLLALNVAARSRSDSLDLSRALSVHIQQQRLKNIDNEMQELNQRMNDLKELRRQQEAKQQTKDRPDYSGKIKAINDQMKQMQDVFKRFANTTKGPSSATNSASQDTEVKKEEAEVVKAGSDNHEDVLLPPAALKRTITEEALRQHEKKEGIEGSKMETMELDEETEVTESVTNSADEIPQRQCSVKLIGGNHKGLFRTRLFGHRKKNLARSGAKKSYVKQMDQEIASMRDELRELEISGRLPLPDGKAQRSRSGSPSLCMLQKKSPPRKKPRNKSPAR